MGRAPRADEAGGIYHTLNRGNARHDIFFKEADFEAFERLIAEGLDKFPIDMIAYQWMSNHWHMVLSPQVDGGMPAFMDWTTLPVRSGGRIDASTVLASCLERFISIRPVSFVGLVVFRY